MISFICGNNGSAIFEHTQINNAACRYVTELLGSEAYISCSAVLSAFRHLDRVMDITDDDPAYVVKFKNAFQRDLAARRADANETWFKVATALDPRFEDLKCL